MARYLGGHAVQSGYYWNMGGWTITPVAEHGGVLPGDASQKYMKVPLVAVFLLMPLLGGLFVVFLPFIGFALFFHAIARKLVGGARRGAEELAATVTPGWVAGEAHLTGKPGEKKEGEAGEPAKSESMEKLEKEIREKRGT